MSLKWRRGGISNQSIPRHSAAGLAGASKLAGLHPKKGCDGTGLVDPFLGRPGFASVRGRCRGGTPSSRQPGLDHRERVRSSVPSALPSAPKEGLAQADGFALGPKNLVVWRRDGAESPQVRIPFPCTGNQLHIGGMAIGAGM